MNCLDLHPVVVKFQNVRNQAAPSCARKTTWKPSSSRHVMVQCKKLIRAAAAATKRQPAREPVQMHRDVWSAKGKISRRLMKNKICLLSRPRLEPMVVALLRFHIRQTLNPNTFTAPPKGTCVEEGLEFGIQVQINDAPASKPQEAPEVLAEIASASTTLKK
jgi:hypothetical protein